MKTPRLSLIGLCLILALANCNQATLGGGNIVDPPNPPQPGPVGPVKKITLSRYQSCDDLMEKVREQLQQQVTQTQEIDCNDLDAIASAEDGTSSVDTASPTMESSGDDSSGGNFTGTNVQEKGVDESDVIKTNGQHVFVGVPGGIDIFAVAAKSLKHLAFVDLGLNNQYGYQSSPTLFLEENRLISLASVNDETIVTVINISNIDNPTMETEKNLPGWYSQARLIDNVLHIVFTTNMNTPVIAQPSITWEEQRNYCDGDPVAIDHVEQAISEAEDKGATTIAAVNLEDTLPKALLDEIKENDCSMIYYEVSPETEKTQDTKETSSFDIGYYNNQQLTGLYSLAFSGQLVEQVSYLQGSSAQVYASTSSVYFTTEAYDQDATGVHRFAVSEGNTLHSYVGSNAIPGHIINQFSMGEYEGSFRIATTTGWAWDDAATQSGNHVYLLDSRDPGLKITGKIENMAPGEQIYSSRFIGNRGYVVTFKKIDPLFVLDLSDVNNPVIAGELKIPGFSTYLHPFNENYLIGLGKDADDQGDFAWFQGLKLSLFDVSDPKNPIEVDNILIGGRGSDSVALYDHHAFTLNNQTNQLALPVSIYSETEGGSDYGDFEYMGVNLYKVSTGGFTTEATIKLETENEGYYYGEDIRRTIFMTHEDSDSLVVLGQNTIYMIDADSNYDIVESLDLSGEPDDGYYWE